MTIIGGDHLRKVVERLQETARDRGQSVGKQWGTPADGEPVSREQAVALWNYRNQQVDPLILQQMMAAGQNGQAVQYVYPYRMALVGNGDIKQRVERANQVAQWATEAALMPPALEAPGGPID